MRGTYVELRWAADPALHAPPRYRRACAYRAFVPEPVAEMEVRLDGDVAALVAEAEARISALNQSASPALTPLARLLLRIESIASSRVEGMQADATSLARGEMAHEIGRDLGRDVAGILANVDAMRFAIGTATEHPTIEPGHLREIHRVLLARSAPHPAGRFREGQGWIGGNDYNPCDATYVPPPEDRIEALVHDLCLFSDQERLSPLVHAAIAHAQFETIHPFDDGNGRTGRALVQVLLRRRGLAPAFVPPISVVLAAQKQRYIDGLVAFREDDLGRWLETFASAAARSADLALSYLQDVAELQEGWRARVREREKLRADAAALRLIDILPGYPVITVAVAVAALEASGNRRSRAAVQVGVIQLAEAGVLQPIGSAKRNRAWEADGLLELITGLEAGMARPRRDAERSDGRT